MKKHRIFGLSVMPGFYDNLTDVTADENKIQSN